MYLRINQTREHEYPRVVGCQIDVEVMVQAIQKLFLHLVDFRQCDARNIGPSLVRIGITRGILVRR